MLPNHRNSLAQRTAHNLQRRSRAYEKASAHHSASMQMQALDADIKALKEQRLAIEAAEKELKANKKILGDSGGATNQIRALQDKISEHRNNRQGLQLREKELKQQKKALQEENEKNGVRQVTRNPGKGKHHAAAHAHSNSDLSPQLPVASTSTMSPPSPAQSSEPTIDFEPQELFNPSPFQTSVPMIDLEPLRTPHGDNGHDAAASGDVVAQTSHASSHYVMVEDVRIPDTSAEWDALFRFFATGNIPVVEGGLLADLYGPLPES